MQNTIFYAFLFVIGAAFGSFLNVLIDRLPNEESIMGRSHCDKCKHTLSWKDLFPLFSFLLLKGKCRYCGAKFSFFYPFIEIFTGITFVLTWIFTPAALYNMVNPSYSVLGRHLPVDTFSTVLKVAYIVTMAVLIVIFFADAKYQIIPDSMQFLLLLCAVFLHILAGNTLQAFGNYLFAAFVIMLPILFLFLITKGRGMGFGDVKLAFVIGFLFGIKAGLVVLYIGFLSGAVVGIFLLAQKKKKLRSKIAFGPFLLLGIISMLFTSQFLMILVDKLWGI